MNKEKKSGGGTDRSSAVLIVLTVILLFFILTIIAAIFVDDRHVVFYMYGEENITLEYGEQFNEPGIYAVSTGRLFGEFERHLPIEVDISGDPDRLGEYTLIYRTTSFLREYSTERSVTVVDTLPPVIELIYDDAYTPTWFTGYEEEGFSAYDECDGDITDKVLRTELDDRIVYTVTDSSGNTATAERLLDRVNAEPQIELIGEAEISMSASLEFIDPGFIARDADGNDVSQFVELIGEVIPYRAGTYELDYLLESDTGAYASAVRTVEVLPVPIPETVMPEGRVIYLTFDDGPGPYTDALLNLLAAYNAKATFFVTGAYPKYYPAIARAVSEGHSVGVHTYSHNYREIYSSEESFFEDFSAMQQIIYEQTGSYTRLCRFPGGSSNTVSRFNEGIMSRLSAALTDLGYVYFDWNVSSGDAGETTETAQVAQNIIDACSVRRVSVVLQHDIKDYSVNAVEKVLIWGINNGYSFCALDIDSPDAHHGIAN